MQVNHMLCCGVKELGNIQEFWPTMKGRKQIAKGHALWPDMSPAEHVVMQVVFTYGKKTPVTKASPFGVWHGEQVTLGPVLIQTGHFIFTYAAEASRPHYGNELRDYIVENKLGNVMQSPVKHNNNYRGVSGHDITCYVWTPDEVAITKWVKAKDPGVFDENSTFLVDTTFQAWLIRQWAYDVYYSQKVKNRNFDPKAFGIDISWKEFMKQYHSQGSARPRFSEEDWTRTYYPERMEAKPETKDEKPKEKA